MWKLVEARLRGNVDIAGGTCDIHLDLLTQEAGDCECRSPSIVLLFEIVSYAKAESGKDEGEKGMSSIGTESG